VKLFNQQQLLSWGIADWGITFELTPTSKSLGAISSWAQRGDAASMSYMTDKRLDQRMSDPSFLLEGCKSALVFLFSYPPYGNQDLTSKTDPLKISRMAVGFNGEDYHHSINHRLGEIVSHLKTLYPEVNSRCCVDTAPLMERDLAYRAGLGFFGKNSMLISPKYGSFTLIGVILLDQKIELPSKEMDSDHCGSCQRCLKACPTAAINPDSRTINSHRCISHYTTHLFSDDSPPSGLSRGEFLYGCDICQEVCPWNRKLLAATNPFIPEMTPQGEFFWNFFFTVPLREAIAKLREMSNRRFRRLFSRTPLERVGRLGVLKNLIEVDE
jgi:epoxyqueuosine reductase